MNPVIQRIANHAFKFNGIVYDILFILFSWIYGLLFRKLVVAESALRFFETADRGRNISLFIILAAAVSAEIIGAFLIIRRMRHIFTSPSEYPEIISSKDNYYSEGDFILFFKFWLIGCRIMLSAYIGYIAFTALLPAISGAAGSLLFIIKDLYILRLIKLIDKPLTARPSRALRYMANIFLAFSGMVFAGTGFDAFMSRSYNVLCNFHHWTGAGNFILSLILYFLFFSILYIPTRTIYYIEELEFTDSQDDARLLRKSFFITAALSIFPWLF